MTVAHTPTGMHELSARTDDERRVASDLDRILARISDGQADIQISIHPRGSRGRRSRFPWSNSACSPTSWANSRGGTASRSSRWKRS